MVCALTACDNGESIPPEPENGPKISVAPGETTYATIAFTLTPTDATACAYMVLNEQETIPSAAVILSDGIEAESKTVTPVTIRGLIPETTYVVVAAVTDGTTAVGSEPLRMTTQKVTTPDNTVVLDRLIKATYIEDSPGTDYVSYYIRLADVACAEDEFGYYQPSAKGTLLMLDLFGEPSPEGNRALPAGTYTLDAHKARLTVNPYSTGILRSDGTDLKDNFFESGEVVVQRKGDTYTLTATFIDNEQAEHSFTYTGALPLEEREMPTYSPITEHIETTFIGAEALYYGNKHKNGLGFFEVYFNDVPMKDGFLAEAGNLLILELNTPLLENGEDFYLPDGTYSVMGSEAASFRFSPGYLPDGQEYPAGSCCEQDDADGAPYYALVTGGTVQIRRSGTTYTVTFDLTTYEQITVKGTYTGEIPIEDLTGWRPGGGGFSTLHMDTTPDLSGISTGQLVYLGNYLRLGYSSFILYLHSDDQPESMEFEVICENTYTTDVATGHYTVMPGRAQVNMVPWTVMPGFLLEANPSGTWYIEKGEEGVTLNRAPANEGTLDISKEGDNYTLSFDFKDDCTEPNRISGTWTGPMEFVSSPFSLKPGTLFRPQSDNGIPQRQARSGRHAR